MRVIIDRFEGDYALCETESKEIINIKRNLIPPDSKEGDVLIIKNNVITIDKSGTNKRKKEIDKLIDDLWED
ncbi:MAG: DUF3006 domain-containing protein [Bacillota bacterium]|nr:DUF3006 domain-containing protein [Bacillota bacterium]